MAKKKRRRKPRGKVGGKRKGAKSHVFGSGMKKRATRGRVRLRGADQKTFKRLTPSYLNWG